MDTITTYLVSDAYLLNIYQFIYTIIGIQWRLCFKRTFISINKPSGDLEGSGQRPSTREPAYPILLAIIARFFILLMELCSAPYQAFATAGLGT